VVVALAVCLHLTEVVLVEVCHSWIASGVMEEDGGTDGGTIVISTVICNNKEGLGVLLAGFLRSRVVAQTIRTRPLVEDIEEVIRCNWV
jgi:hypothetical protein